MMAVKKTAVKKGWVRVLVAIVFGREQVFERRSVEKLFKNLTLEVVDLVLHLRAPAGGDLQQ